MIDLSPTSYKVLQWATDDARDHKTSLIILYTYRLKAAKEGEQKAELKKRLEKEAYERFEQLSGTVDALKNVPFTFVAEVGFETDRLEAYSQNKSVRIIVLSKDTALAGELHKEWNDFISKMTVPLVLVP